MSFTRLPVPFPPRLLIRSPSPTTIQFTVTTYPLLPSYRPTRYVLLILLIFLRLGLFWFVCCVWCVKWGQLTQYHQHHHGGQKEEIVNEIGEKPEGIDNSVVELRQTSKVFQFLKGTAFPVNTLEGFVNGLDWRAVILAGVIILWGVTKRYYTEESLLVIRGLGIQTSSIPSTYLSLSTLTKNPFSCSPATPLYSNTRFIPTSSIQDIFINEGFKGFQVKFYLSVVVKGEEEVVVVFPKILPRRRILEVVWRRMRECLYEGVKEDGGNNSNRSSLSGSGKGK